MSILPPEEFDLPRVSTKDMLLGSGPRFARDGFGPMLVFYAGWRAFGLVAGIAAATAFSLGAYLWERRQERPGLMARIGLVLVAFQAVVGLASQSEFVYLAQPVLISGGYGLAFLVSAAMGRPLTGLFAEEMYQMPDMVKASETYRRVFGRISIVWGVYLLARSALRLVSLNADVEAFLVVNLVTGMPVMAFLMAWSVWYGVRGFRRSEEWGPAIAALEAVEAQAASVAGVSPVPPATPSAPAV